MIKLYIILMLTALSVVYSSRTLSNALALNETKITTSEAKADNRPPHTQNNNSLPIQIAFGCLLFIFLLLYWRYTRRRHAASREHTEQVLKASEQRFLSLLEALPAISVQGYNTQRQVIFWNSASERVYGYSKQEAMGKQLEDLIIPAAMRDHVITDVNNWLESGIPIPTAELELQKKNGQPISVFSSHVMQTNSQGQQEMFCVDIDLSASKQAQEQLKTLSLLIRHSPNAVMLTNTQGTIEYVNPKFTEMTGFSAEEVLGQPPGILSSGQLAPSVYKELWQTILSGKQWRNELHNRKKNGDLYWVREFIAPITNDAGEITHFASLQEDITESKRINDEISHRASHDMLTGLINRSEFERCLEHIVNAAQQNGSTHMLCFLDLDQFKVVNDSSGHVAGDELLRQLAASLIKQVRKSDTLARIGGDEFAILMEYCDVKHASLAAENIRHLIEDFQFNWKNRSYRIGASIGLTLISASTKDSSEALKQADLACYAAKDRGRNRIHLYQKNDAQLAQQEGDIRWVARITEALENNYFRLFVQSIKPISQPALGTSYEVLLRLQETNGELIPPGGFLPAIERYNLAYKIDRWVIEQTFQWLAKHRGHMTDIHHFAINLSGQSLGNETLLNHIITLFKTHMIPAETITFEITETAAISNLRGASHFIKTLKKQGCQFALDDFGSGLSSFAYLKNLPVDYLKIDGMFVKDILDDPIDLAMVRSINDIGHVMNLKTIAEFVENQAIEQQLAQIGVDFAQGYGISKPFPIEDLLK